MPLQYLDFFKQQDDKDTVQHEGDRPPTKNSPVSIPQPALKRTNSYALANLPEVHLLLTGNFLSKWRESSGFLEQALLQESFIIATVQRNILKARHVDQVVFHCKNLEI